MISIIQTERGSFSRVIQINVRQVKEPIRGFTDGVIANESIGSSKLQIIDHVSKRLPEFLARHLPSYTCRGEKAEAVILVKPLRAVVSEIKFREIFTGVGVGKPSRYTYVSMRKRSLQTTGVPIQLILQ